MADGLIEERGPNRGKFLVAYFLLAAIVGFAVAAFLVFMRTDTVKTGSGGAASAGPAAWNGFRPVGFTADQVHQIATRVSSTYHLPDGQVLVAVKASIPPAYQNSLIITDYAVSVQDGGRSSYEVIPAANSVNYELCGLGPQCSIASGKPSVARNRLLRREALELALYTFHFEPSIQTVVTYMPPAPGQKASFVLLFLRSQLAQELSRPLSATLPEVKAPLANAIPAAEAQIIDGLTAPDLYRFSFTRGQDGGVWLVFNPPGVS